MPCNIFKDEQGNITRVEDRNGNPSKLYADALRLTNNESQAENIWAVGNSEEYGNTAQTEPLLSDVLTFMQRNNAQNKTLNKQDLEGLRNNTLSLPFSFIEELHTQIQYLYPNGVFTINRSTLRNTRLYTNPEINAILNDTEIQSQIKDISEKIIADVSLNNKSIEDINSQMALYETPEMLQVYENYLVGFGKFNQINPFLLDKQIRETLGGVKNREEFERLLQNLNPTIVERYEANPQYANQFFETYSSMERMQVLQENANGELVTPQEIVSLTEQALVIGQDATELKSIIDLLLSTPKTVWENSGVEIEDMLLRVEDYSADLGIDVVGISTQEFTYEEAMDFLESLITVAENAETGNVSEEDLQNFYDNHNLIFKTNLEPLYTAREINPNNRGRNLVVVDTNLSEQELFDNNSLVKVNNEGVYQRVSKQEDIEGLYDYITDLVQFNPNIIDKKALYPSAYTQQGNFSYRKASDITNRENIRQDIIRYVQQQPLSENLVIYKLAFGHPLTFPVEQKDLQTEFNRMQTVRENFDYLTRDFIADFAQEYIKEKQLDTEYYNNVLSHFTFNERGIILKDTDLYSKQQIALLTPENALIRQYAAISKDVELNTLFPVEETDNRVSQNFIRNFYLNNPEQLPQKTVQNEVSEDGEYMAVQNLADNYLNIQGTIWEKARDYKNISIYQRLPMPDNPNFNNYTTDFSVSTKVDVGQFESLVETLENLAEIQKMYSDNQVSDKEC